MNSDQAKGSWKELKGKIQAKWGKITDDELEQAKGNSEQIAGIIQKKYGDSKEDLKTYIDSL